MNRKEAIRRLEVWHVVAEMCMMIDKLNIAYCMWYGINIRLYADKWSKK